MGYSRGVAFLILVVCCGVVKVFCEPYDCGCRSNSRRLGNLGERGFNVGDLDDYDDEREEKRGDATDYRADDEGSDVGSESIPISDEVAAAIEPSQVNCKCADESDDERDFDPDWNDGDVPGETESISATQRQNKRLINRAILWGVSRVCKVEVDNPVLAACGEGEIDKILISLPGVPGNRSTFSVCEMSRLEKYKDMFKSNNVTYFIVNGWPASNHLNPMEEFNALGECRPDVGAIVIDIGRNLPMVYNTLNNNSEMIAYLIYRIIIFLFSIGIDKRKIVFVGASIGAQVLAMGITLLNKDSQHNSEKLERFYGLDPTVLCKGANFITADIANQVVILHGDGERYGVKKNLGTVDVYPNGGIGYQPGCDSYQCSHVRPIILFIEAVCNPNSIIVIKCRSWKEFTKGRCARGEKFDILNLPVYARGEYYFRTGKHANFGLGHNGVVPYREFCFD